MRRDVKRKIVTLALDGILRRTADDLPFDVHEVESARVVSRQRIEVTLTDGTKATFFVAIMEERR